MSRKVRTAPSATPWLVLGVLGIGGLAVWRARTSPGGRELAATEPPIGEVEALARVIASEAGGRSYSLAEQRAIAWAVRNRARHRRVTIARLVCSPECGPCCRGRPFSSRLAATVASRALAAEVLAAPASDDPTGGALAFFEPAVQDALVSAGRPGYRFTSSALRERWEKDGQRPLGAVGKFEFYG